VTFFHIFICKWLSSFIFEVWKCWTRFSKSDWGGMIQRKHQMSMLCITGNYETLAFIYLLVWFAIIWKILMKIIFNLCIIMLVWKWWKLAYVKYGTTIMKNQMCLTHQNVLDHATMFHKHTMKNMVNSSFARVLHQMIPTSQFYPTVGWVVPFHNVGMNYQWVKSSWKCRVAPHLVDLQNLTLKNNLSIPQLGRKFENLKRKNYIIISTKKMSK